MGAAPVTHRRRRGGRGRAEPGRAGPAGNTPRPRRRPPGRGGSPLALGPAGGLGGRGGRPRRGENQNEVKPTPGRLFAKPERFSSALLLEERGAAAGPGGAGLPRSPARAPGRARLPALRDHLRAAPRLPGPGLRWRGAPRATFCGCPAGGGGAGGSPTPAPGPTLPMGAPSLQSLFGYAAGSCGPSRNNEERERRGAPPAGCGAAGGWGRWGRLQVPSLLPGHRSAALPALPHFLGARRGMGGIFGPGSFCDPAYPAGTRPFRFMDFWPEGATALGPLPGRLRRAREGRGGRRGRRGGWWPRPPRVRPPVPLGSRRAGSPAAFPRGHSSH